MKLLIMQFPPISRYFIPLRVQIITGRNLFNLRVAIQEVRKQKKLFSDTAESCTLT
jgi:hypothetical protein